MKDFLQREQEVLQTKVTHLGWSDVRPGLLGCDADRTGPGVEVSLRWLRGQSVWVREGLQEPPRLCY